MDLLTDSEGDLEVIAKGNDSSRAFVTDKRDFWVTILSINGADIRGIDGSKGDFDENLVGARLGERKGGGFGSFARLDLGKGFVGFREGVHKRFIGIVKR